MGSEGEGSRTLAAARGRSWGLRRLVRLLVVGVGLALSAYALQSGVSSVDESALPSTHSSVAKDGRGMQTAGSPNPVAQGIPIIDFHVHLSAAAVPRLTALMARYGIERIVNLSGGDPTNNLDEQMRAAASAPGKITVFTTLAYGQATYPDYGLRMARLLEIAHARGARGLKIAKVLGLGLRRADGTLIPVDDPALDPVFEAAGRLGMPITIHTGDPEAFWLPVDEHNPRRDELEAHPAWALYGKEVPSFDQLLHQLETRIARHPGTTFISVHFGNAAERPEWVAQMLRKYPNMYIDTAARIPEMGRHSAAAMRALFLEFQDRILYGSDLGVGPAPTPLFLGSQGASPPTPAERELFFSASRRYFETADEDFPHPTPIQGNWKISGIALPRSVLRKVYHDNAVRLLGLDSRFPESSGSGTSK
jgi:predicted TIM-barrel fold metal-dependent hydrolase